LTAAELSNIARVEETDVCNGAHQICRRRLGQRLPNTARRSKAAGSYPCRAAVFTFELRALCYGTHEHEYASKAIRRWRARLFSAQVDSFESSTA
jgi:hypothetical protein